MNIVLTGFMGTGKSTVGRRLARELGLEFLDLDDIIEKETGLSISDIFSLRNEKDFRRLESEAIQRLVSGDCGLGVVLSTGGGAVVSSQNRKALRSWGRVVLLTASVDEILKRVHGSEARPLLSKDGRREAAAKLLVQREEAYKDCDLRIDTTGLDVTRVVDRIKEFLKEKVA